MKEIFCIKLKASITGGATRKFVTNLGNNILISTVSEDPLTFSISGSEGQTIASFELWKEAAYEYPIMRNVAGCMLRISGNRSGMSWKIKFNKTVIAVITATAIDKGQYKKLSYCIELGQ